MGTQTWQVRTLTEHERKDQGHGAMLLVRLGLSSSGVRPSRRAVDKVHAYMRARGIRDASRLVETMAIAVDDGGEVVGAAKFFPQVGDIDNLLNHEYREVAQHMVYRPVLSQMGVLPEYRRQGIGAALVEEVIADSRKKGCEMVWGFAEGANGTSLEDLVAFYRGCGFTVADHEGLPAPEEIYGPAASSIVKAGLGRVGRYFWMDLV